MNPQATSAITTLLTAVLASAGTWLVTKGVLTTDQASALTPELVAIVPVLGAVALGWWKSQQHTPAALVAAVNSGAVPNAFVAADTPANINVPQVIITKEGNVVPDPMAPVPKIVPKPEALRS